MTHKNTRGGSLLVDLVFPAPVRRLARASGTTDPKLLSRYVAMLRDLWDEGRADVLLAIKRGPRRGGLSIAQVYAARKSGQPLPSAETLTPLAAAWARWLRGLEAAAAAEQITPDHVAHCRRTGERLAALAPDVLGLRPATIGDLLPLMQAVRAQRLAGENARAWKYDRSNAQAFVRDTLGAEHALHAAIGALKPIKATKAPRPPHPLTVRELVTVTGAMTTAPKGRWVESPAHAAALDAEAVALCWTMALTSMGPKELWGTWSVEATHVHVHGTKRKARVRDVPRVLPAAALGALPRYTRPTGRLTRLALEGRFVKATTATVGRATLYDLRRSFAKWCENAGIPHSRIVRYMGHAAPDMTTHYQSGVVAEELREDTAKLVAYLTAELEAGQGTRKTGSRGALAVLPVPINRPNPT